MSPTGSDSPSSSKASLLSGKTTSSNFTASSKKKAKGLLDAIRGRKKADSDSSLPSGTSSTSLPSVPEAAKPSDPAPAIQHPAPRNWDAAFGQIASEYGFGGPSNMAVRAVAPSKKFKERTAPTSISQSASAQPATLTGEDSSKPTASTGNSEDAESKK